MAVAATATVTVIAAGAATVVVTAVASIAVAVTVTVTVAASAHRTVGASMLVRRITNILCRMVLAPSRAPSCVSHTKLQQMGQQQH